MIEVRDAVKSYGSTIAVDGVSFAAPAGKVTALLGPNGAGKTTTVRMLLGLARPDSGSALIYGRRYQDLEEPRSMVGAALDSMGFHPGRSGRDHLMVMARAAGIPAPRVDKVLKMTQLTAAGRRRTRGYSRGMKQRLALAGALLGDPRVLILDEPNIGLDPAGIAWLRDTMRGWAAEGRAVLVSSHVLSEVELVADRVVIIDRGRVLRESGTAELGGEDAAVIVRSPDIEALQSICRREGWPFERTGPNRLTLTGALAEPVGRAAAAAGIPLSELSIEKGSAGLEQLFLKLTAAGRKTS